MNGQTPADDAGGLAVFFVPDAAAMPPSLCADVEVMTPDGPKAIGVLPGGSRVLDEHGQAVAAVWCATRTVNLDFIPEQQRAAVSPVRIGAGALGDGLPARAVALSPTALLWIDGAFFPAGGLVDGAGITQPPATGRVVYCQVLADGALLEVEGLLIGSLDDAGWINGFGNADGAPATFPPLIQRPRATARMVAALRARIAARLPAPALADDDADPMLSVGGRTFRPVRRDKAVVTFVLAGVDGEIRLLSRSMIPAELPGGVDQRRLGLCVRRIVLRNAAMALEISPESGQLRDGFHPAPDGVQIEPCWTDGFALLPPDLVALMGADFEVEVHLAPTSLRYIDAPHAAGKAVLVLDASLPTPDRDAGSNVMIAHIALLQALGYAVTFVPVDNFARIEPYASALEAAGVELVHRPGYDGLAHFLAVRGAGFALAYVHRLGVAEVAIPLLRAMCPGLPIVYNTADLHWLRSARAAEVAGDQGLTEAAGQEQTREYAAIAAADLTLLCNSAEMEIVQAVRPAARLAYLPWVRAAVAGARPGFAERAGIMFLGGFAHPPNVDAMRWFVGAVMPVLRARRAGIRLTIYGADLPDAVAALARDDVVIGGYLPDLTPAFDRHRLSVAPLRYGAGFKGKLAESLAHGVPLVASPIAAEGTGTADNAELLVALEADAMADAIIRLYRDPLLWGRLAAAGREYVATRLSPEVGLATLRAGLQAAGVALPA